ncbi:hypothetical protein E2986_11647 [Frieseomelitta varia]|uniref:Uncharacterized protein n=1 Tax=Frieseomelitta varia TaxID=561572 RepID=A0A833SAY7_9HYME|nr:hypothetical protein E2986_11647 [Frieseomelitta varia]
MYNNHYNIITNYKYNTNNYILLCIFNCTYVYHLQLLLKYIKVHIKKKQHCNATTHLYILLCISDNVCLVCYVSNGHIATYSLPSLRPLIDVDFLPLIDLSFATKMIILIAHVDVVHVRALTTDFLTL